MRRLLLLSLLIAALLAACARDLWISEVSLPERDVDYMSPMSVNLFYKVLEEGPSALGQVFLLPEGHGILKTVKFYLNPYPMPPQDPTASMFVQLRVSPWERDRPSRSAIWESEPANVKRDFRGWLNFDLPRVKLERGKKYVAWLTLAGLQNPDDAALSVATVGPVTVGRAKPASGPWTPDTWTVPYPLGTRAMWTGSNPSGTLEGMTKSAWKSEFLGNNFHFKMVFVNN
jgi:hypothetical protein